MSVLRQSPDRVVAALASLEGNADFDVVLSWLEESLDDLREMSCFTKDEIVMRWQQGACQALADLVQRAKMARQTQYSRRK